VAESLVPSLRENTGSIPLQTFWGSDAYVNPSCDTSGDLISDRLDHGRKMAWSRGLSSEVSPIKTRSARKKQELDSSSSDIPSSSTLNLGALRGMKSLARENS
jgi:hypothetical protein